MSGGIVRSAAQPHTYVDVFCVVRVLYHRQTVIDDVTSKFENQSVEELAEQKTKIQDMLNSGEASVDSEFWEAVLKELHVFQVSVVLSLTA